MSDVALRVLPPRATPRYAPRAPRGQVIPLPYKFLTKLLGPAVDPAGSPRALPAVGAPSLAFWKPNMPSNALYKGHATHIDCHDGWEQTEGKKQITNSLWKFAVEVHECHELMEAHHFANVQPSVLCVQAINPPKNIKPTPPPALYLGAKPRDPGGGFIFGGG